jgi:hypothetical protein
MTNTPEPNLPADDWGTIDRLLKEFEPMMPLLTASVHDAATFRCFMRWFFSMLETMAHALKRIAAERAKRQAVDLSPRERDVLQVVQEPRFAGLPPPRRVEASLRESLCVALNLYARTFKTDSPLVGGLLPADFIDASVVFDRLARPDDGSQLDVKHADLIATGNLVGWFSKVRAWLYAQRNAEIDEIRTEIKLSFEETKRRLSNPNN